jgi:hypothetical protein
MAFFRKTISVKKLLKMVARGEIPRFVDLRGNYRSAIPGSIPVQFYADIFYENEQWVQDMLGVKFHPYQPVIIICDFGQTSEEALDLFMEKNPKTIFDVRTLKGGLCAYRVAIENLTKDSNKRDFYTKELLSLSTKPARFQDLIAGMQNNKKSFLAALFN